MKDTPVSTICWIVCISLYCITPHGFHTVYNPIMQQTGSFVIVVHIVVSLLLMVIQRALNIGYRRVR